MVEAIAPGLEVIFVVGFIIFVFVITCTAFLGSQSDELKSGQKNCNVRKTEGTPIVKLLLSENCHPAHRTVEDVCRIGQRKEKTGNNSKKYTAYRQQGTASKRPEVTLIQHRQNLTTKIATHNDVVQVLDTSALRHLHVTEMTVDHKPDAILIPEFANMTAHVNSSKDRRKRNLSKKRLDPNTNVHHQPEPDEIRTNISTNAALDQDSCEHQKPTVDRVPDLDSKVHGEFGIANRTVDPKSNADGCKRRSGPSVLSADVLWAEVDTMDVDEIHIDDCLQIRSDQETGENRIEPVFVVEETKWIEDKTMFANINTNKKSVRINNKEEDGKIGISQFRQYIGNRADVINDVHNCHERRFPDRQAERRNVFYERPQSEHTHTGEEAVENMRLQTDEKKSGAVRQRQRCRQRTEREVIVIEADEDADDIVEGIKVVEHSPNWYSGRKVSLRQDVGYYRCHTNAIRGNRSERGMWEKTDAQGPSYSLTWSIGDVISDLEANLVNQRDINREEKTDFDRTYHRDDSCDNPSDVKDISAPPSLGRAEKDGNKKRKTPTYTDTTSDLKDDNSDSSTSEESDSNIVSSETVSVATFADRLFLMELQTMNDLDPDKVFVRKDGILTLDVRCGTKKEVHAIVVYFLGSRKGEQVRIVTGRGLRSPQKIPVINKVVEEILMDEGIHFKVISLGGAYEFDY